MSVAKRVEFVTPDEFLLEGFRFRLSLQPDATTPDCLVLVKDQGFIASYCETLPPLGVRRAFEFGIFQGGSAIFHTTLLDLEKFVCLDRCGRLDVLEAILAQHPIGSRIRCYYRTSQDDEAAVRQIFAAEFADAPPDLIIDDASHFYQQTKRSFEIAFPYLREGGHYVIEDWAWAHWPQNQDGRPPYGTLTAMSNFILELVLLLPSTELIDWITVRPGYVMLRKRAGPAGNEPLNIDARLRLRGRSLVQI